MALTALRICNICKSIAGVNSKNQRKFFFIKTIFLSNNFMGEKSIFVSIQC